MMLSTLVTVFPVSSLYVIATICESCKSWLEKKQKKCCSGCIVGREGSDVVFARCIEGM